MPPSPTPRPVAESRLFDPIRCGSYAHSVLLSALRRALGVGSLAAVLGLGACSLALNPGEPQCETDDDCDARGFAGAHCVDQICGGGVGGGGTGGAGPFSCLGNVIEPVPDTTKTINFTFQLAYATDSVPLTDGDIDVCDKLDVDCTGASTGDYPKNLMPDASGNVSLTVHEGFDGFVRVTATDTMDSRIYVGRPVVVPPKVKQVQLLRPQEYAALVGIAQLTPDPTRGTAIVLGLDCNGDANAGIRFESPAADGNSKEFYLVNQQPALPPDVIATDKDGFGGFYNLKPSATVVRSYLGDQYIGESSFSVLANTISYVQVAPTPQ